MTRSSPDIVERLRYWLSDNPACMEAADEIERLRNAAQAGRKGSMAAQWTYDPEAEAYYFAPLQAAPPPYLTQRHVDAILDIAADGTLAGVELIDNVPPPPTAAFTIPVSSEPQAPQEPFSTEVAIKTLRYARELVEAHRKSANPADWFPALYGICSVLVPPAPAQPVAWRAVSDDRFVNGLVTTDPATVEVWRTLSGVTVQALYVTPPANSSEGTREAIEALREWHKFQSGQNTSNLYNAAGKLFGAKFDPTEYDNVE